MMNLPIISIIMPVFNTGAYLIEAINSVLHQKELPDCALPSFELIIVNDRSTEPQTLATLAAATMDPRVHVFNNQRKKGVAGARNTGIANARGTWIGFLDSDDIWFPHSLAVRWRVILQHEEVKWLGAQFTLMKPRGLTAGIPVFGSVDGLMRDCNQEVASDIKYLARPVEEFGKSCMLGIMTVLIKRKLIVQKGMFNEQLPRSEDYHLWFKCAFDNNLWLVNSDVAFYRIHPDSLTHGNNPLHMHEDTMIEILLKEPFGLIYKTILLRRFDLVMQDNCYFYRRKKLFAVAFRVAVRWIVRRPLNMAAWKELVASSLRSG